MKSFKLFHAMIALIALCVMPSAASAQTGGPFDLSWHTIDGGGIMVATGGPFTLAGTLGQADASEPLVGGAFSLSGGFWPGATGVGPCSGADFVEPFGTLDFFDVLAFLNAFTAMQPAADMNNDTVYDFFDVQIYLGLFAAGCP